MNKEIITHWRTRSGDIPIASMTNEHIQNSYYHSERKYMENHNFSLSFSETTQYAMIKKYDDLTRRWKGIMRALEYEYEKRGLILKSLADGAKGDKFQILRNERILQAAIEA